MLTQHGCFFWGKKGTIYSQHYVCLVSYKVGECWHGIRSLSIDLAYIQQTEGCLISKWLTNFVLPCVMFCYLLCWDQRLSFSQPSWGLAWPLYPPHPPLWGGKKGELFQTVDKGHAETSDSQIQPSDTELDKMTKTFVNPVARTDRPELGRVFFTFRTSAWSTVSVVSSTCVLCVGPLPRWEKDIDCHPSKYIQNHSIHGMERQEDRKTFAEWCASYKWHYNYTPLTPSGAAQ